MKIYPCAKHGVSGWLVDWRVSGKRHRKWFASHSDARQFAATTKAEVKDYGEQWAALTGWERGAIVEAYRRARGGGYTLTEACEAIEAARSKSAITVADLCERCKASREDRGLDRETIRQARIVADLFTETHGERMASSISPEEIAEFLKNDGWGPRRRLGVLKELRSLFNFGTLHDLVPRNPAKLVPLPKILDTPPKILTVEQARKLMTFARAHHPAVIPYLACTLFAGARDIEAKRLRWADVDFGRSLILMAAWQTKTRMRRLVPMHDTCASWLALERKRKGDLLKSRADLLEMRKAFGGLAQNVLRHSYISYEMARSENEQATAARAGTSPQKIHQHYRELVRPEDAKKFWEIVPS